MFEWSRQSSFQLSIGQRRMENELWTRDTQSIKLQIYDWVIEMRGNNFPPFVELTHSIIIIYYCWFHFGYCGATPTSSSSISFASQR